MIYKDIAEYEETDSKLAKQTIFNLHTELDNETSKTKNYIQRLLKIIQYIDSKDLENELNYMDQGVGLLFTHIKEIAQGKVK